MRGSSGLLTGEFVPLPAGDLVFGLCDVGEQHVVVSGDARAALDLVGGDPRVATAVAICRRQVRLATAWGPYSREAALERGFRCADCVWILALVRGDIEAEIDQFVSCESAAGASAINARLGDVGRRVLAAIAADPALRRCAPELRPSQQTKILGHAARHLAVVVVCEECADYGGDDAHGSGQVCPAQKVICASCTPTADDSWAGEWVGTFLNECIVAAPCSVLAALAAHYRIPTGPVA